MFNGKVIIFICLLASIILYLNLDFSPQADNEMLLVNVQDNNSNQLAQRPVNTENVSLRPTAARDDYSVWLATFEQLWHNKSSRHEDPALIDFFSLNMTTAPEQVLNYCVALLPAEQKSACYLYGFATWLKIDLPYLLHWQNGFSSNHFTDLAFAFIAKHELVDFYQAISWTKQIQDSHLKDATIKTLMQHYVKVTPELLLDWALSQDNHTKINNTLGLVYEYTAQYSPTLAINLLAYIADQPMKLQRSMLSEIIFSTQKELFDQALLDAIIQQPDTGLKLMLLDLSMPSFVGNGMAEAMVSLLLTLPDNEDTQGLQRNLVRDWARSQPQEAANYASQIMNANNRRLAMARIITQWIAQDLLAAEQWLEQQLPDNYSVSAINKIIHSAAGSASNRDIAFKWQQRLLTKKTADDALEIIIIQWYQENSEDALHYLANTALSQDRKLRLNKKLTKSEEAEE